MTTILILLFSLLALLFLAAFFAYYIVFHVPRKKTLNPRVLLPGAEYDVFADRILRSVDRALEIEYEEVLIRSHDGLKLYGRYYETRKGAPLQILFHGYKSMAIRDFSGGLPVALNNGFNVLLVDQRAHGKSSGSFLSFGIHEREDCLDWVKYAVERFGPEVQILLFGISMGAATVLMSADLGMPENVRGIIGDCGYTSPADIIRRVMRDRQLPVAPLYLLLSLGAEVFGRLDLEAGALDALRHTGIPVLLIHGEDDHFVPCEMSRAMFGVCSSDVTLITVPGAGHGLSSLVDKQFYWDSVSDFTDRVLGASAPQQAE